MAKKKATIKKDEPVKEAFKPVKEATKPVRPPKPSEVAALPAKVTLEKYFQYNESTVHAYTRSALKVEFHGIIKTVAEWNLVMEKYV